MTTAVTDTKEAILDAAEAVFAEVGFEKASIRQIVAAAGVNLAAVHYHFGSKEALIEAIFARCVGPVNARRMELLGQLESDNPEGRPPLDALLRAFLAPLLQDTGGDPRSRVKRARLFGRLAVEPTEDLRGIMQRQFGQVMRRFGAAFKRAVPDVSEKELMWRLFFTVGGAAQILIDPPGFKRITRGLCDPSDTEDALMHLVRFASAGMAAATPAAKKEVPR